MITIQEVLSGIGIITLFLIFFSVIFFFLLAYFIGAPYYPSSHKVTKRMIELAEINEDDVVYDFGSGDGRLILAAAKMKPKTAIGFEINPYLNLIAKSKALLSNTKNVSFITQSYTKAKLKKCTKLFVYLLPESMRKIEDKVFSTMPKGSLVITNTFHFKEHKPIYEDMKLKINIYEV